jgi:TRAP-type transport system small permease protein
VSQRGSKLERTADAIASGVERVLALALIAGIVLNFANVVGRYLAGFALTGVDEIEIYILIWIAFLGAALVTWRGQHLRMDVLLGGAPLAVRNGIALLEGIVLIAVASFVTVESARYVERIYALGAMSDIARVPTWIPHSAVCVGFGAIALIVVVRTWQRLMRPHAPPGLPESVSKP